MFCINRIVFITLIIFILFMSGCVNTHAQNKGVKRLFHTKIPLDFVKTPLLQGPGNYPGMEYTIGLDENIYIIDAKPRTVYKLDLKGKILSKTNVDLDVIMGIAVDKSGNIFAIDLHHLVKINPKGDIIWWKTPYSKEAIEKEGFAFEYIWFDIQQNLCIGYHGDLKTGEKISRREHLTYNQNGELLSQKSELLTYDKDGMSYLTKYDEAKPYIIVTKGDVKARLSGPSRLGGCNINGYAYFYIYGENYYTLERYDEIGKVAERHDLDIDVRPEGVSPTGIFYNCYKDEKTHKTYFEVWKYQW